MDRTPFHPFCSQGQNEQNVANAFCTNHSHSGIVNKKTRSQWKLLAIQITEIHRDRGATLKVERLTSDTEWGGGGAENTLSQ